MNFLNTARESATKATERGNKVGRYEHHDHQMYLNKYLQPSVLLIGDSNVTGLFGYKNLWKKYFKHIDTVNSRISGDKTQLVLMES